jgi:hypothetical protein
MAPNAESNQEGTMTRNRIAGVITALALLAVPAVASAHGNGHHSRHHHKHHAKKAQTREVTGTATATVASFTNGELTIALPSGKTFSALVTDQTVIECQTAAPQTIATTARDGGNGGGNGDDEDANDDDNAPAAGAPAGTVPSGSGQHDDDDENDDHGDDNGNGRCGTEALVAGAKVAEAKLSLKGVDATWKKVEILK